MIEYFLRLALFAAVIAVPIAANDCSSRPLIETNNFRDFLLSCLGDDGNSVSASCVYQVPFDCWDTSEITSVHGAFQALTNFNQPVGSWDMSKVTDMHLLFYQAESFDQPLDSWEVSKVTSMASIFTGANVFNQPLDSWDVGSVTDLSGAFYSAYGFNQPLGSWDVSSNTNFNSMFKNSAFNQNIDSWDVSSASYMLSVFADSAFNQCFNWEPPDNVESHSVFVGSDCPNTESPDFSQTGPWCRSDCFEITGVTPTPLQEIGLYEILHATSTTGDTGQLSSGFPDFGGAIFFEASDSVLANPTLTLLAKVYGMYDKSLPTNSACSEGVEIPLLANDVVVNFFLDSALPSEDQFGGTPTTSGGSLGQAQFEIKNFNSKNDATDGNSFDVCIRIGHWVEGLDYVSFIDTRFAGTTNYVGGWASFSDLEISIGTKDTEELNTAVESQVGVEAFLCDRSNVILGGAGTFSLGQDFRICVRPATNLVVGNNFIVSDYRDVQCSNGNQSRNLVKDLIPDAVTRLETAPDQNGALALTSLVLPFFFEAGSSVMTCSGVVVVSSQRRNLLFGNNVRALQDVGGVPTSGETAAIFSLGIQLDINGVDSYDSINESSAVAASGVFALSVTAVTAVASAVLSNP